MADEHINYSLAPEPEALAQPTEYHVMVLLVDDQAMVCEAVRRALANQADIDFHYCSDARGAIERCVSQPCFVAGLGVEPYRCCEQH